MNHTRDEVLKHLKNGTVGAVATFAQAQIRSRMMHYAIDDSFSLYLATLKNDPKTFQLTNNPTISFLVHIPDSDPKEIEISGKATFLTDGNKESALIQLAKKSPVVEYLLKNGQSEILDVIKVTPYWIKYRVFSEIVRGEPPFFLELERMETSDWCRFKNKLRAWWICLRIPFLTASVIPILIGVSASLSEGIFNPLRFFLTLLAGIFIHLGVNITNDYFDSRSGGTDWINREFIRPFSGGSRVIQLGLLTPLEVFLGACLFYLLALVLGLWLTYLSGPWVLILGLIGFISGFFYVAPPFKWVHQGIGELLVGLNFGVLMVLGAYYVQTSRFSLNVLLASVPISILVAAILFINQFPDYEADKKAGKFHLVIRWGKRKSAYGYAVMIISSLILQLSYFLTYRASGYYIFSLIPLLFTTPISVAAIYYALRHYNTPVLMVPANALTIILHLTFGLFTVIFNLGHCLSHWSLWLFSGLFLIYIYYHFFKIIRRAKAMTGLYAQTLKIT